VEKAKEWRAGFNYLKKGQQGEVWEHARGCVAGQLKELDEAAALIRRLHAETERTVRQKSARN